MLKQFDIILVRQTHPTQIDPQQSQTHTLQISSSLLESIIITTITTITTTTKSTTANYQCA